MYSLTPYTRHALVTCLGCRPSPSSSAPLGGLPLKRVTSLRPGWEWAIIEFDESSFVFDLGKSDCLEPRVEKPGVLAPAGNEQPEMPHVGALVHWKLGHATFSLDELQLEAA